MHKILIPVIRLRFAHSLHSSIVQDVRSENKHTSWEYVYRKRDILDDIPYRKLIRGVFVIQDEDKKRIIDFLERFSAEYYVRVVELTEEDCEIMGLQME